VAFCCKNDSELSCAVCGEFLDLACEEGLRCVE